MSWRPEGWDFPKKDRRNWDIAKNKWDIPFNNGWASGYESGADAMLEAIFKDIPKANNDYIKAVVAETVKHSNPLLDEALEAIKEVL